MSSVVLGGGNGYVLAMKLWLLATVLGGLAMAACGGPADTKDIFAGKVCVPGATQECACPGGVKGAQACREDGAGFDACACVGGSGSGGSAGGGGDSGSGAGSSGAGGSCSPRTACPAQDPTSGTTICGALDDYCGGTISCGCEFGACSGGACQCDRISSFDQLCVMHGGAPIAMQCTTGMAVDGCERTPGGFGFPVDSFCCKH
jgi:hypothetical protein